jgi:flagellar basal-body rod protein FlgB
MAGRIDISDYIAAGLKVTGLQSRVISNNIANMTRPGFRRSEVHFQELLAKALEGAEAPELAEGIYQPRRGAVNERGNDVDLDAEIGEMIRSSTKARVYLRALAKVYDRLELALRDRM